ncbi:9471_t:CDS:2 [Entrophospora sp. SA101]|nr:9471_t:CDS:2 [Entrophospora sp. SA101]
MHSFRSVFEQTEIVELYDPYPLKKPIKAAHLEQIGLQSREGKNNYLQDKIDSIKDGIEKTIEDMAKKEKILEEGQSCKESIVVEEYKDDNYLDNCRNLDFNSHNW